MSPRPRVPDGPVRGFSLTELLVVLAVVGVLAGLLIPALSFGRFRSKVTVCMNQYRQWGIAAGLYATDDGRGRLPSYPLPVDRLGFVDPWIVAHPMVTNLGPYGITVPLWYCPFSQGGLESRRKNFRELRGRELVTVADLVDESDHVQKAGYFWGSIMWWVPRNLSTSLEFPDPLHLQVRTPDPWPRRLDDPTVAIQPIISDRALCEWDESRQAGNLNTLDLVHAWGLKTRNLNLGFADGRVETRPRARLQWQARRVGGFTYVY